MFTGIIEATGEIREVTDVGTNRIFWIKSPFSADLKIDQSLCHDGVCLTVEATNEGMHQVTAIQETIRKTNIANWKKADQVNLERSLLMNSRLDGHLVQGHVDTTGVCKERKELEGSYVFRFEFPKEFSHLVIEKGSICLNGISLTIFDVKKRSFRTAIIPYTFEHTNIRNLFKGLTVNIEFDIIGKYVSRFTENYNAR
jgi:riboflavin synthase